MKLATLAVHAGDRKRLGEYVPATTPIYGASSYAYPRMEQLDRVFEGEVAGQGYARYGNPTCAALEEQVAALEGADVAVATASGMAALYVALTAALSDRRKSIVAAHALLGDTFRLLSAVLEPAGVETKFADCCDLEGFEAAVGEQKPGCVLVESVSNPMLRVSPLDRITEIAHRHGALVVVDATFVTPVLMRPLSLGADLVVHSATKYLAGHADVLGGVIVANEPWRELLLALTRNAGSNLGAFDACLTMRGIKTLPLRIERQCRNARHVADSLAKHPRVERVHFPGSPNHPDHGTACRLFGPDTSGEAMFGAMVSFEIKDAGREEVFAFLDRLELVVSSTSLGDVHSLIAYPAISSHRNLSPKHRRRLGIGDNLVRLSVGIEAAVDIVADLAQALEH